MYTDVLREGLFQRMLKMKIWNPALLGDECIFMSIVWIRTLVWVLDPGLSSSYASDISVDSQNKGTSLPNSLWYKKTIFIHCLRSLANIRCFIHPLRSLKLRGGKAALVV